MPKIPLSIILFTLLFSISSLYAEEATLAKIDSTKIQDSVIDSTVVDTSASSLIVKDSIEQLNHFTVADSALDDFSFGIFAGGKFQFINFKERSHFQDDLDSIYNKASNDEFNEVQNISVQRVNYQKVNVTLPAYMGIEIPLNRYFRLATSLGYFYGQEEAILIEGSKNTGLEYALDWWTLHYEFQLNLSEWLINTADFPQIFFALNLNQLIGTASLRYMGNEKQSENPYEIMGWGFSVGSRQSAGDYFELEMQLGLDFQSTDFGIRWNELIPSSSDESFISPSLNTFWFGLRLIYKL